MSNFKPMLAASTVPDIEELSYPVLASPKLDGIRCVIIGGIAYSRNLKPIPNAFVQRELAKHDLNGLDGELMINGDFNSVQAAIMSEHGEPDFTFNVFDDFSDATKPFYARASSAIDRGWTCPRTRVVPHQLIHEPEALSLYLTLMLAKGYEGLIVRNPEAKYKFGRSTLKQGWMLKLKKFDDDEAEIIGFEELMHNENPAEIGELGQTKHSHEKAGMVPGNVLGAFICQWKGVEFKLGTGFDSVQRRNYWKNREVCKGSLAKFKYQGVGPNGKPRFPVFLGFRHEDDL